MIMVCFEIEWKKDPSHADIVSRRPENIKNYIYEISFEPCTEENHTINHDLNFTLPPSKTKQSLCLLLWNFGSLDHSGDDEKDSGTQIT